eukprot:2935164-Pleurochrysis_carterae.AAC.2
MAISPARIIDNRSRRVLRSQTLSCTAEAAPKGVVGACARPWRNASGTSLDHGLRENGYETEAWREPNEACLRP